MNTTPKPTEPKPAHGGARRGAGRPSVGRMQITLRLKPSTIHQLEMAAGRDRSISDYLDFVGDCLR